MRYAAAPSCFFAEFRSMRIPAALVLAVAAPLLGAAAPAPHAPAAKPDDGRYTVLPATDGGFVRLDRVNGTMSLCKVAGGDLDCRISADQRSAMQAEIDRLAKENDRLKARLTALGEQPGDRGIASLAQGELTRIRVVFEDLVRRLVTAAHALIPRQGEASPSGAKDAAPPS